MSHCLIEIPSAILNQFTASMHVDLLEVPAFDPTTIIHHDQSYVLRVCLDFNSPLKNIICAEFCINVGVEGCGAAKEFSVKGVIIDVDPCKPGPYCVDIKIAGTEFELPDGNHCGEVFNFCITAILRDKCDAHLPIGIAGMCSVGPVMVY